MRARQRHLNARDAGALLVLDSRFITGLSDTDPVSTWPDRSRNANNATSTSTNRPTYKVNELNGNPILSFDGIDDKMSLLPVAAAGVWQSITIIKKSGTGKKLVGLANSGALAPYTAMPWFNDGVFVGARNGWGTNATLTDAGAAHSIWYSAGTLSSVALGKNGADISLSYNLEGPYTGGFNQVGHRKGSLASGEIAQILLFLELSNNLRKRLEHAAALSFKIPCS